MALILYLTATSGGGGAEPSMTHSPLGVANPYRTVPDGSLKLSVKVSKKQEMLHRARKHAVMISPAALQRPRLVRIGARTWNARTVPVGRRFARLAVLS